MLDDGTVEEGKWEKRLRVNVAEEMNGCSKNTRMGLKYGLDWVCMPDSLASMRVRDVVVVVVWKRLNRKGQLVLVSGANSKEGQNLGMWQPQFSRPLTMSCFYGSLFWLQLAKLYEDELSTCSRAGWLGPALLS